MANRTPKPPSETERARKVLDQAHDSVAGFLKAFETVRQGRRGSTDEEQDLLRASLVFAAAGLDSVAKELIKGCIRSLAASDSEVQKEFETFVRRRVGGPKFLASILVADSPQARLIDEYVLELTGSSLQSASQLNHTAKALALDPGEMGIDENELKPIFRARNKIIHELDVNLGPTAARRNLNSRSRPVMEEWSSKLLDIASNLTDGVDAKLRDAA